MKVVAITGGIASGKSQVCTYLQNRGVSVYNADARTKQLYYTNDSLVKNIEQELKFKLFDNNGNLNKLGLAHIIFNNKTALYSLEAIVHPVVIQDFFLWKSKVEQHNLNNYLNLPPFVVIESAIILSKPLFTPIYDYSILIDAPMPLRIKRAMERDNCVQEDVIKRINNQVFNTSLVDGIINNNSSLSKLYTEVDQCLCKVLSVK